MCECVQVHELLVHELIVHEFMHELTQSRYMSKHLQIDRNG